MRENTATGSGGAAALHSAGVSGFYNTGFACNSAGNNGGAVYDYTGASETTLHSCTLTGNSAANYGGAMFASNGGTMLYAYNTTATGNSAKNGGVLYETTTGVAVTRGSPSNTA